jgi:ubiquitin carboxyl-terminal hydrolase 36/42
MSALGRQFRAGRQEDSHEFIRCLLERMCRSSLRAAGVPEGAPGRLDETTVLHQLFGGYFRNQVHCTTCGFDSNTFDSFMDISLEVGKDLPSVAAALRHFCKPEVRRVRVHLAVFSS